jgi:hypothetical protein
VPALIACLLLTRHLHTHYHYLTLPHKRRLSLLRTGAAAWAATADGRVTDRLQRAAAVHAQAAQRQWELAGKYARIWRRAVRVRRLQRSTAAATAASSATAASGSVRVLAGVRQRRAEESGRAAFYERLRLSAQQPAARSDSSSSSSRPVCRPHSSAVEWLPGSASFAASSDSVATASAAVRPVQAADVLSR